jgi:hypothetical protein
MLSTLAVDCTKKLFQGVVRGSCDPSGRLLYEHPELPRTLLSWSGWGRCCRPTFHPAMRLKAQLWKRNRDPLIAWHSTFARPNDDVQVGWQIILLSPKHFTYQSLPMISLRRVSYSLGNAQTKSRPPETIYGGMDDQHCIRRYNTRRKYSIEVLSVDNTSALWESLVSFFRHSALSRLVLRSHVPEALRRAWHHPGKITPIEDSGCATMKGQP